jgi:hypothetical protein
MAYLVFSMLFVSAFLTIPGSQLMIRSLALCPGIYHYALCLVGVLSLGFCISGP